MNIQTRFAIGQTVHRIGRRKDEPIKLPCKFCRGARQIRVSSPASDEYTYVSCPSCQGIGSVTIAVKTKFTHLGEARIGKVRVELYDPTIDGFNGSSPNSWQTVDPNGYIREESYMVDANGFPSGSVFHNVEMFATRDEADDEIERRNEAIDSGEAWKPDQREVAAAQSFLEHADVYEHTPEHIESARALISAYEFVAEEEA